LPNTITSIGDNAFYFSQPLNIYYNGTEEQWNAITIGNDNNGITNGTIYYNSTMPEELR
jgi:hypothetical protein